MPAGRTPKPTNLKRLLGNPGKRPLNDREPQPRAVAPHAPKWLTGEARALWKRLVPELKALGLLTVVDGAALAACCQAWEEFVECTAQLKAEGRVVREPVRLKVINAKGLPEEIAGEKLKAHPAVKLQRDAFARVKSFLGEFGLTPASRTRVRAPAPEDKEKSPLEKLLGQRAGKN